MRLLITILLALMLSGCTGLLIGGDVSPPEKSTEDDESEKKR